MKFSADTLDFSSVSKMANDEDSFVTVGTAFDVPEEDAPKKKAPHLHEQIVTDTEGRRRFHGAFTGGFSAGYFNTVGSKEGWTPSSFVSSRSKRFESSRQKPEDFMDEDDLGDFGIAPRNVETTKLFSQEKNDPKNRLEQRERDRAACSLDSMVRCALDNIVVPCRMSIGVKLLKKMGWKEGQGIGPRVRQVSRKKVYGCERPSTATIDETEHDIYAEGLLFAPKDTNPITFVPKDNQHGIGYKGMITPSAPLNTAKPGYSGNLKIKGQAFGVGAFEEDDEDVYSHDSMANYDIEIQDRNARDSHLYGWTGPPAQSGKGGALSAFAKASQSRPPNKVFPPPAIPRGYQPFVIENKTYTPSEKSEPVQRPSSHLTSDERRQLLGEVPLPNTVKSVFDFMSKSDKNRIVSAKCEKGKTAVKTPTVGVTSPLISSQKRDFVDSTGFQPFAKDPMKQTRYDYFLECRKSGNEVNTPKELCGGLTEWEREREKDEFLRSAMIFQPLRGRMAARFTAGGNIDDERNDRHEDQRDCRSRSVEEKAAEKKMFGKLTRSSFEWHPAKLLCKRFNIPEPYPSSKTIGLVEQNQGEKFNLGRLFNSSTRKTVEKSAVPVETKTISQLALSEPQQETNDGDKSEDMSAEVDRSLQISEQRITEKPSIDLFKAIFANSSEESGESESEDEDQVTKEQVKPKTSSVLSKNDVGRVSGQITLDDSVVKNEHSPEHIKAIVQTTKDVIGGHITQDSLRSNELEYGPLPPPRISAKPDNIQRSEIKSHQTVPFSGSMSESENEVTHKKTKKRKHKRKHKKRQKEKEKRDNEAMMGTESKHYERRKVEKSNRKELPNDKEILSKLKSVQKRRMCAADFM